jgi:hypothetical protein
MTPQSGIEGKPTAIVVMLRESRVSFQKFCIENATDFLCRNQVPK